MVGAKNQIRHHQHPIPSMTQLAKDCGLGRERLYKALSPGAKPRYETVMKVIRALGVKLHADIAQTS